MSDSLKAPWDRSQEKSSETYVPKQVELTEADVAAAVSELTVKDFVNTFPRVDKFYADPVLGSQVYGLHSFVPTEGARPDEHGVYGFVKFRGAFATQQEADERAEFIIRSVDSFHDVYTSYIGRPFPLSDNRDFVKETNEVDVKDQIVKAVSQDVKAKVIKDRAAKDDIKDKEQKLLDESKNGEEPADRYVTLQVKRANLVHVYVEATKSLTQYRDSILKCRKEIAELEAEDPKHREEYMERYNAARDAVGLEMQYDNTYLRYMGIDDTKFLGF